jgi:hypothetical protein
MIWVSRQVEAATSNGPGRPGRAPFAYGGATWVPLAGNWHGPATSRAADLPAPSGAPADRAWALLADV